MSPDTLLNLKQEEPSGRRKTRCVRGCTTRTIDTSPTDLRCIRMIHGDVKWVREPSAKVCKTFQPLIFGKTRREGQRDVRRGDREIRLSVAHTQTYTLSWARHFLPHKPILHWIGLNVAHRSRSSENSSPRRVRHAFVTGADKHT